MKLRTVFVKERKQDEIMVVEKKTMKRKRRMKTRRTREFFGLEEKLEKKI